MAQGIINLSNKYIFNLISSFLFCPLLAPLPALCAYALFYIRKTVDQLIHKAARFKVKKYYNIYG